jgi:hypothetical protein
MWFLFLLEDTVTLPAKGGVQWSSPGDLKKEAKLKFVEQICGILRWVFKSVFYGDYILRFP